MLNLFERKGPESPSPDGGILEILDKAAEDFRFPALDNGYVYLAATRLTAFHCPGEWALVVEVFGFSPRSGQPDLSIQTFASSLSNRNPPSNYVTREAYENYLKNNKNNEFKIVYPIENDDWVDPDDTESVASSGHLMLRGKSLALPTISEFSEVGIVPSAKQPAVFEMCRFLAAKYRDDVLATTNERGFNVPSNLEPILTLEDWIHPDLVNDEKPSGTETFRQLAKVLATGNVTEYTLKGEGNTHWKKLARRRSFIDFDFEPCCG